MSTDQESKRQRRLAARAERQKLAEQGRRRAQQRKRLTMASFVVLGLAVLGAIGMLLSQNLMRPSLGRTTADEGRNHVNAGTPLNFRSNPPASGEHYPVWSRPGAYTEPQDPGNWVHSLEHGYVVVLYNCPSACPELVSQLRTFYDAVPKSQRYGYQKLVITPYAQLEGQLAMVSWARVLELPEGFNQDTMMTYYRTYVDKGPEDAG